MFAIRLYVAALTVTFLLAFLMTSGIGVLHGIVLVCALLYMILDAREDLQELRHLEAQVALLSR
jgi:hypothetical protein